MKTCPLCFKTDLDDKAEKCPHCGGWQAYWKRLISDWARVIGGIFIIIFIFGFVGCAASLIGY